MYVTHADFVRMAVERLGFSPSRSTWARLCRNGGLPAVRLGGRWVAPKAAVERYLLGLEAPARAEHGG